MLLNWWCYTSKAAVNDVYLRNFAKASNAPISVADKNIIEYIAPQCPYTGGTAVYVARALQAAMRRDTFYNDTENCFTQGINYRVIKPKEEIENVKEELNIKVFPNPASSFVVLSLNATADIPLAIEVIDVLGRVVYQGELPKETTKYIINTNDWSGGIYQIKISKEGEILNNSKVIIVK